jgi:ABC-type glycerol-3-phosphate transport system permease component
VDRSGLARTVALHLLLIAIAAVAIVPLVWLVCACFKTQEDLFAHAFLPWHDLHRLTLGNFRTLFAREPVGRWLVNSLLVSSLQTVLVVALSSLGGFALAKYRFLGRRLVMGLMLATMLLPGVVLLPSSWLLMYHFGWLNGYAAVIVPGSVSAFGTFLFMQAMRSVPDELLEAGRVDGCSELRLWWDLALPVVRPMVGAYTLLAFTASWNSFLWPRVVLQDEAKYTLPLGLSGMIGVREFDTQYGVLMCGTLIAVLPVVLLFSALQRDFVSGLAAGAVKG